MSARRVPILLSTALMPIACGRYSPDDTEIALRDTSDSNVSVAETDLDTDVPDDTYRQETATDSIPTGDSGDSDYVELEGEFFECGEWSTKAAPNGHILMRDAELVLEYDWQGSVKGASWADTDGDGCSEVLLTTSYSTGSADNYHVHLPGTLAETVNIEERATSFIQGGDQHLMLSSDIGDLDGNGIEDDWVIGAQGSIFSPDNFTGAVYLYHEPLARQLDEDAADTTIWPPTDARGFCEALDVGTNAGMVPGAIAIGGHFGQDDAGRVVVLEGPFDEDISADEAVFSAEGTGWGGGAFGSSLSFDGDLNGDGFDDLVPTAYEHDGYRGAVYVFYGPTSGTYSAEEADRVLLGEEYLMQTGHGISGGADANGDGYDDLLIGSPGEYYGAVYLVLGPVDDGEELGESGAVFQGDGQLGLHAVSISQDMDADGFADLAMASSGSREYSDDPNGAAFLFYGPVTGTHEVGQADAIIYEEDTNSLLGEVGGFVVGLGDTDGDGFDDLMVGMYGNGPPSVFRGGPR